MAAKLTHGMTDSATYRSWSHMKSRCGNLSNPNYGAKGIRVCERWLTFANFLADMGVRPEGTSIDRIDQLGNYESSNCRWATAVEQANNKPNNVLAMHDGQVLTAAEIAARTGQKLGTVRARIHREAWRAKYAS